MSDSPRQSASDSRTPGPRKDAPTPLHASHQDDPRFLQRVLAAVSDYLFACDAEGRFLYASPSMARAFGFEPGQIAGMGLRDLGLSEKAIETLDARREEVLSGGEAGTCTISVPTAKGVRELEFSVRPLHNQEGVADAVVATGRDVTEHVRTEEALDAIISSIADGVIIYSTANEILRMNPAAERILGYAPEKRKLPLAERIKLLRARTPDGRPVPMEETVGWRALRGEIVQGKLEVFHLRDGRKVWVSVSAAPVRSPGGDLLGAVATYADITSLHALQEQREELLRTISHDLRSPLTAVMGHAQILYQALSAAGLGARMQSSAEAVEKGAKRMNAMIQDLVDSTRLESGQLTLAKRHVNLKALVIDVIATAVAPSEAGRLATDIPEDLPSVNADPPRLERVLTNLLSNALKYSRRDVLLKARRRGSEVVVSVIDEGPGIAPEELQRIFERFYRAESGQKGEGLGLGLYITRMLVEAHGGTISADSEPGKGTAFTFTIPVATSS